jgi:N-dimethylarginine dimethylaminohydrolase
MNIAALFRSGSGGEGGTHPRAVSRREYLQVIAGAVTSTFMVACDTKGTGGSGMRRMLTIRVQGELGKLRTAIVHDGSNAVDVTMDDWQALPLPEALADEHPEAGPSSKERLIEQHGRLRKLLTESGVTLLSPQTQPEAFGQVFARDPGFAIGETLFIGGLTDEWRLVETTRLRDIRTQFARVNDLTGDGATIEGGDVMVFNAGQRVLVGMHRHTNEGGLRKLLDALAGSGIEVIRVPHKALHLDGCLAPLPNGEALYASGKLPESSVAVLTRHFSRLIALDADEADRHLATNLFWLDQRRVVSGVVTKKTNALLREKWCEVIELDFADLVSL